MNYKMPRDTGQSKGEKERKHFTERLICSLIIESQEMTASLGKQTKTGLHRAWNLRAELWNEGVTEFIHLDLAGEVLYQERNASKNLLPPHLKSSIMCLKLWPCGHQPAVRPSQQVRLWQGTYTAITAVFLSSLGESLSALFSYLPISNNAGRLACA